MEIVYSFISVIAISSVAAVAVWILYEKASVKQNLLTYLISFASGALIGDVFIHLLPEYFEEFGYGVEAATGIITGIAVMLLAESYFHCSHDSQEEMEHHDSILVKQNLIGDFVHNFLDGVAIGASYTISVGAGLASTVGVFLHEVPQEISDVAVLALSGWKKSKAMWVNLLTGLSALVGVGLVVVIGSLVDFTDRLLIPLAVGQFLYIALADLIPQVHKHKSDRHFLYKVLFFLCGVGVMYVLLLMEL